MDLRNLRPVFFCLTAAALFGASIPLSKLLLSHIGPLSLAGLLYLGAAGAMGPYAVRARLPRGGLDPKNVRRLAGAILFGGVLGPVLLLLGLSGASAASVALWLNLETVATGILALVFFREHLHGRAWLAMALVVGASVLLAAPSGFEAGLGATFVALACICWGCDNNLTALIDGLTPAQITMAKGLVAGGINLGLGLWAEGWHTSGPVVAAALGLGALSYGLSLVLYIGGAQQLGAARANLIFSTGPFWGVLLAWMVNGESISWQQVIAGTLMLVALVSLHAERHGHRHTHEALTHRHWHRHDDGHHDHAHPGLPAGVGHTHEHAHEPVTHSHPHLPDLHHRHRH